MIDPDGNRVGVVYALYDSRNSSQFRYIGVSYAKYGPTARYKQYISESKNPTRPVAYWVRQILAEGAELGMMIVTDTYRQRIGTDMYDLEVDFIGSFRKQGHDLLNVAEGGRGGGYGPKTDQHRANISASLKGKKKPPRPKEWGEAHAAKLRGRRHSEATKAKMRAALIRRKLEQPDSWPGYERTPEHRQRMSDAQKKRYERQRNENDE